MRLIYVGGQRTRQGGQSRKKETLSRDGLGWALAGTLLRRKEDRKDRFQGTMPHVIFMSVLRSTSLLPASGVNLLGPVWSKEKNSGSQTRFDTAKKQ